MNASKKKKRGIEIRKRKRKNRNANEYIHTCILVLTCIHKEQE